MANIIMKIILIGLGILLLMQLSPKQTSGNEWRGGAPSQLDSGKVKLRDAIQTALSYRKPLLIDFYADYCIPCKAFDGDKNTNEDLVSALGKVIFYRINAEKGEAKELMSLNRFGVYGFPT